LIVTYVHPLFLKAHSAASKAVNPSWRRATRGKFSDEYWKAIILEIATLEIINANAWLVIDQDDHQIANTWAFKCKRYPDGGIQKFKASVHNLINNSKELISLIYKHQSFSGQQLDL
jgi:hypothetical protein